MKKKNGFTLIELLAVIIILGVLMVIAVPAVTKYINDSRKNGYVSTAKNLASGARNLIHSGKLDLDDPNTTYYIDGECIKTEGTYKSPYGDFSRAYVVVTADYNGYEYYWTSVDDTGIGVKSLIRIDKLDSDNIEEGITSNDITTNRGLDGREHIVIVNSNCEKVVSPDAQIDINGLTGKRNVLCQRATTLHTATCERTTNGCATITYGTIPGDTLKSGDAFDCDVNKDNVFDAETERFYYITDDGTDAVLLYYKAMNNSTKYAYDSTVSNGFGPRIAYQYLPSTSDWKNKAIILPGTRQIVNMNGTTSVSNGTIQPFTYTDKAARLITYQELQAACGSNIESTGGLNSCSYVMEKIPLFEAGSGTYGFWLETPDNSNSVYMIHTAIRSATTVSANVTDCAGVKAVITTKLSNLE